MASSAHEIIPVSPGVKIGSLDLSSNGTLEGGYLVILEDYEERWEQDNGLAQTGVKVVMGGVDALPFRAGPGRTADGQVFHSNAEVSSQVADHLFERVDFVEEL